METLFIINPNSGKLNSEKLVQKIEAIGKKLNTKIKIHLTRGAGDGKVHVEKVLSERIEGEGIRIFACGGDGTLHEVVQGAFGYKDVEIGCLPTGTGNDFVRNFGDLNIFLDIEKQMLAKSQDCDLIKYSKDSETAGCCVNMFNIGFDCNVVEMTAKLKKKPLISGSMAYYLGILIMMIKKKGADLRIQLGDEIIHNGKCLLIAIGNGCFCGGGIKALSRAKPDDGWMDYGLIKNATRRTFIRGFKYFAKGTLLDHKTLKSIIKYDKCKSLQIFANQETMKVCIDGEVHECQNIKLDIIEKGFKFIVPKVSE